MSTALIPVILHVVAGLIVLAEALNKLERCHLFAPDLSRLERLAEALKALAWLLLALGAGGAIAGPLMLAMGADMDWLPRVIRIESPTLDQVATMVGFAVLVVRTRVKEAIRGEP
jgi:hypothetical protein